LVRHVAQDDVTYRAGVDIRGRKLEGPSVDIAGNSQVKGPTIVEFDGTRDLPSFLGGAKADAEAAAAAARAASSVDLAIFTANQAAADALPLPQRRRVMPQSPHKMRLHRKPKPQLPKRQQMPQH
jgi:hypothetical protein